jgi:hypothetical protein
MIVEVTEYELAHAESDGFLKDKARVHCKRCLKTADYAACAVGAFVRGRQFHGMSSSQRAAGQSAAILAMTSAI